MTQTASGQASRLQEELQRLFLPTPAAASGVRALLLEAMPPGGWDVLGPLWQAVQTELGLPAPAIAVSGSDACQLWFSLAQPVTLEQGQAFLDGLRARYLAALPPERLRLRLAGPAVESLPPRQLGPDRWGAFVAPDLAPLFADEPWLDHPPAPQAQAELLSRCSPIGPEAFDRALAQLAEPAAPAAPAVASPQPASELQPREFLLSVMRDPAVALALRIEAAKALLAAGSSR